MRRQLTPKQQNDILALGIPGVGFPAGKTPLSIPEARPFPTVVGHVNIDNRGIAGMEKYVDGQGLADLASVGMTIEQQLEPVRLVRRSARPAHCARRACQAAMQRYRAIAAGAVVLNAKTGEVLAMSSLPDYDPNMPAQALEKDRMNRMSAGTYEMGSTFKAFTTAMALDSGLVSLKDSFDARRPIRIAGHTISDFHGKHPGPDGARDLYLLIQYRHGQDGRCCGYRWTTGIPDPHRSVDAHDHGTAGGDTAQPTESVEEDQLDHHLLRPRRGNDAAADRDVGGGPCSMAATSFRRPFLPRSEEPKRSRSPKRVIKPETSAAMRYLMRLNVKKGSGQARSGARLPGRRQDRHGWKGRQRALLVQRPLQRFPFSLSRLRIRNMSCL